MANWLSAYQQCREGGTRGEKVTFTIAEVQAEGVVANDGQHISFGDIWQLEKRHVSGTKTGMAITIPVVLLALIAYVATHFGP
jgi:hypothetical protein